MLFSVFGVVGLRSLIVPDRFILHIRISGRDDADQRSHFSILLHLHDGAFCWMKDGGLIYVRHADPDDGLVSERAQVNEAGVHVLIYCLHHHIVCALALKVQWLEDEKDST